MLAISVDCDFCIKLRLLITVELKHQDSYLVSNSFVVPFYLDTVNSFKKYLDYLYIIYFFY